MSYALKSKCPTISIIRFAVLECFSAVEESDILRHMAGLISYKRGLVTYSGYSGTYFWCDLQCTPVQSDQPKSVCGQLLGTHCTFNANVPGVKKNHSGSIHGGLGVKFTSLNPTLMHTSCSH